MLLQVKRHGKRPVHVGIRELMGIGMSRDAVASILVRFPIVRRKDEERYGEYRTKETILALYDEMCP